MNKNKTILITGASGNLGAKLRKHLQDRYPIRLIDIDSRNEREIIQADLSIWNEEWVKLFQGVDTVVHFAADPDPNKSWDELMQPNIDAAINVFHASGIKKVKRIVFASSNHVMGGYKDKNEPKVITTDLPPLPGTHHTSHGRKHDSTPYGSAKFLIERLGKCYAEIYGMEVIAVRIGWNLHGENRPEDIFKGCEEWFRLMWLSNRDFCHLMERCIEAEVSDNFVVVNGMSANTGMRWDIGYTKKTVGYQPADDVTRG
ncbi:MAG: NAD(P)-dependent oxidoreductase [Candidatus Kuenenia sp.]|nr:NAD(P)-dependent oxidoreductase [Candidatus Kuenenia hertensis]